MVHLTDFSTLNGTPYDQKTVAAITSANPEMFNTTAQCGSSRTAGAHVQRQSTCPWYVIYIQV